MRESPLTFESLSKLPFVSVRNDTRRKIRDGNKRFTIVGACKKMPTWKKFIYVPRREYSSNIGAQQRSLDTPTYEIHVCSTRANKGDEATGRHYIQILLLLQRVSARGA